MRRFVLILSALFFPIVLSAQMFPLSDQYVFNTLAVNPAFAGCHDALSATILYRNQWVGFRDAPKNYMFSAHTPLYNDRIGLGLLLSSNSIGINKETSFIGNYAYRMDLRNGKLALGLGFGAVIYKMAWNELNATDQGDALLNNNPTSAVLPNFSLGAYYYNQRYFIGISLPMFLSHELNSSNGKYKAVNRFSGYNYFLMGGYFIDLNPGLKLLPSLLIKYHPDNALQIDYNAQLILKDRIWLGAGYRSSKMLIGMFQFQLNHQLRMAYSYDFDFGQIGKFNNGSHEIVLNYIFSYDRKVIGPRQF
jgi:type IX secretion system PorP/SprF family membrane protein